MAGERELAERGEDPDPRVSALLRRQDEDRLGEVHLAGERLHPLRVEPPPVGEDGELVALQRRFGEDVEEDVGRRALLGHDTGDALAEGRGEEVEIDAHRRGTYPAPAATSR